MRTLGNILWHFPFFGFIDAALTFLLGLILTATVVAAPIGLGLMEMGKFFLAPFGRELVDADKIDPNREKNEAWQTYSKIIMIIWLPFGLLLAFFLILQIIGLLVSIIGIPVAMAMAKTLGTVFNPVNKKVVSADIADELRRQGAQAALAHSRGQ